MAKKPLSPAMKEMIRLLKAGHSISRSAGLGTRCYASASCTKPDARVSQSTIDALLDRGLVRSVAFASRVSRDIVLTDTGKAVAETL